MDENFNPDRSLLNPKFEGYRLDLISQDDAVSRLPLKYQPSQTASSGRAPLSFKEVQSRITHNHITTDSETSTILYVDADFQVVLVDLNSVSRTQIS